MTRRNRKARNKKRNLQAKASLKVESLESRLMFAGIVDATPIVDLDLFAANIEATMGTDDDINAIGYAYSVASGAHDSDEYESVSGAHGHARLPVEDDILFEPDTSMEIASSSKPVTGAAIVKLLQDNIISVNLDDSGELELSEEELSNAVLEQLDKPMYTSLPADWQAIIEDNLDDGVDDLKDDVAEVTWLQLLQHESGFTTYSLNSSQLEQLLKDGLDEANGTDDYSTTNFSFLRELTPYLWSEVDNEILDGNKPTSDLPEYMQDKLVDHWGSIDVSSDKLRATLYELYVQTHLLLPAGVFASTVSSQSSAYVYDFDGEIEEDTGSQRLKAGGRGWNMSAEELSLFLTHLNSNDAILRDSVRSLMFENELGIFMAEDDLAGPTYGHSGGNHGGTDNMGGEWTLWNEEDDEPNQFSRQRVNTRTDIFPNDVVASIVINSQVGGSAYGADLIVEDEDGDIIEGNSSWKSRMLRNAYEASLIGYEMEGDFFNDNTFVVQYGNDGNDPTTLEVYIDDVLYLSTWTSVLQTLELNGIAGDNTFKIHDLPDSLTLTINAGADDDRIELGDNEFSFDIDGNLVIDGGTGENELIIMDSDGTTIDYTLDDEFFSASSFSGSLEFDDIDLIEIYGNIQDNVFNIIELDAGTDLLLDGSLGDDEFYLFEVESGCLVEINVGYGHDEVTIVEVEHDGHVEVNAPEKGEPSNDTYYVGDGNLEKIESPIVINGGNGIDSIVVDDSAAPAAREFDHTKVIEAGFLETPGAPFESLKYEITGSVVLQGGPHDDIFNIRKTTRPAELTVNGGMGDDEFNVTRPSKTLTHIESDLVLNGEDGQLPPNPNELPDPTDNDILKVYDSNAAEGGHYEVSASNIFATLTKGGGPAIVYAQMEKSSLDTSDFNDIIDIHSTPLVSGPLTVNANDGNDFLRSVPVSKNQIFLANPVKYNGGDGSDELQVFDDNSLYDGRYSMSHRRVWQDNAAEIGYGGVEKINWHLNDQDNDIVVTSTSSGSLVNVHAYDGDDDLIARNLGGELTFIGEDGTDTASLRARKLQPVFKVQGNEIRLDNGNLRTDNVESRELVGVGSESTVVVGGVDGVNEIFQIQPSNKPGAGRLQMSPYSPIDFARIVAFDVVGSTDGNDVVGIQGAVSNSGDPNQDDVFSIEMGAAGTAADPVLTLKTSSGKDLLALRNYVNFGVLIVDGLSGGDRFEVSVEPSETVDGRFVQLFGGTTAHSDQLAVEYEESADFIWNDFGVGSGAMSFDFEDEDQLFQLLFNSMEDILDPVAV